MTAKRLLVILRVLTENAPESTVVGEHDHAGFGNTLRVNYNGPTILDLEDWEVDDLGEEVNLYNGYAIIVVN